ncbi:hypothetical protein PAXINDRAFT_158641, partial [Paxillus involutus ATCC 200175]
DVPEVNEDCASLPGAKAVAALERSHSDNTCMKLTVLMIKRELSTVRGMLVEAAEKYAWKFLQSDNPHHKTSLELEAYSKWLQAHVNTILNTNDTINIFLHEHDSNGGVVCWFRNQALEDLYIEFCGRTAHSKNTITFKGAVYANYSNGYRRSMVNCLNNEVIGKKFRTHLIWLNQQGL